MEWKIQQHKVANNKLEIQVSILVKEMKYSWANDAETWASSFHDKLKEIPRTNIFAAEYGYKATIRNRESLEVWKIKVNGDFNYKMFTIDLIK